VRQFVDTDIHQEPMSSAVILHWLAESHDRARSPSEGILIPWAMLGLGLISTESTLMSLPLKKQSLTGWLRGEGARSWRGYSKQTIIAWRDTFWNACAHGDIAGVLDLQEGRLIARGKVDPPKADSRSAFVRRVARAVGGTLGGEQDDLRIASALGLEFVE